MLVNLRVRVFVVLIASIRYTEVRSGAGATGRQAAPVSLREEE
jgi:hypothetical protein